VNRYLKIEIDSKLFLEFCFYVKLIFMLKISQKITNTPYKFIIELDYELFTYLWNHFCTKIFTLLCRSQWLLDYLFLPYVLSWLIKWVFQFFTWFQQAVITNVLDFKILNQLIPNNWVKMSIFNFNIIAQN